MAKNPLLKINFATSSNPPYAPNDELIVYFDDSTLAPYMTLNGVVLIDPSYNVSLGLPFSKDAGDNITTEYKMTFLDSNLLQAGGLELNYVKPLPSTPNQDDPHIGQPVLPPAAPTPAPPTTPIVPVDISTTGTPRSTRNPTTGRPTDLKFN